MSRSAFPGEWLDRAARRGVIEAEHARGLRNLLYGQNGVRTAAGAGPITRRPSGAAKSKHKSKSRLRAWSEPIAVRVATPGRKVDGWNLDLAGVIYAKGWTRDLVYNHDERRTIGTVDRVYVHGDDGVYAVVRLDLSGEVGKLLHERYRLGYPLAASIAFERLDTDSEGVVRKWALRHVSLVQPGWTPIDDEAGTTPTWYLPVA